MSAVIEYVPVHEGHLQTPMLEELVRRNVADAAMILDEHVPGWAWSITRPLNMRSCRDCVLGQVFEEPPRRFFGLLRGQDNYGMGFGYGTGFGRGLDFFNKKGVRCPEFAFSSAKATPYWRTEIEKRR